jgi:hypothetical protein
VRLSRLWKCCASVEIRLRQNAPNPPRRLVRINSREAAASVQPRRRPPTQR